MLLLFATAGAGSGGVAAGWLCCCGGSVAVPLFSGFMLAFAQTLLRRPSESVTFQIGDFQCTRLRIETPLLEALAAAVIAVATIGTVTGLATAEYLQPLTDTDPDEIDERRSMDRYYETWIWFAGMAAFFSVCSLILVVRRCVLWKPWPLVCRDRSTTNPV